MCTSQQGPPTKGPVALVELERLQAALALHNQGNFTDAEKCYEDILKSEPDHFDTLHLLGVLYLQTRRIERAVALLQRAVATNSEVAAAHDNLGNALLMQGRLDEAVASYDRATALQPDFAIAYYNRGIALKDLNRLDEAVASLGRAIALKPDTAFALGLRLHTKMQLCDWSDLQAEISYLLGKVELLEHASTPHAILAISHSRSDLRNAATTWTMAQNPEDSSLPPIVRRPQRDKIKVGYFSSDFRAHATAWLIAELIERHDRSRFEVIGFSFRGNADDEIGARLEAAFDRFIDVRTQTDTDVALLARKLELDISIDLNGFTQHSRTGIFARRASPLQVNYLGYPGTMGAEYMDYLIGDPVVIPDAHRVDFTEKIVWLPDSYQPNDTKRRISDRVFTRSELGLPADGFVFCCFNKTYKITPDVFDSWMRILRSVPQSVLWLLEDNAQAAANLRREAERRGVSGDRLVFAPRMDLPEHLSRHRLADLLLDTLPCNAHTTASDALWAGLPVLTRLGETFPGRVAASLLTAIGLPELITDTAESYEALAIGLARDPARLARLRQRLAANRLTTALFDISRYTRHIEAAYEAMCRGYHAGLPPDHIIVSQ